MQPNEFQPPQTPPSPAPVQPAAPVTEPVSSPPVEQPVPSAPQMPESAATVVQPESEALIAQPAEVPEAQASVPVETPEPEAEDEDPNEPPTDEETAELPAAEPVQWQATEYIQHDKSPAWYIGFAVVAIVLMVAAVLLIKSWTFAILIPIMAAALMVYSHRPPRNLGYVLSGKGLYINDQLHPLGEFKGFGVMQEVNSNALMLIPVKRFRPGLTVYFPSEVGEKIVDILGVRLPMQDLHQDAFDKIVRRLRL